MIIGRTTEIFIHTHNAMDQRHIDQSWKVKQSSEDQIEAVCTKILQETETEKEKQSILCKKCKNEITTVEYTTVVNGQHAHIFKNPAGITFHIGCFSKAWGCIVYDIPSYEFTWFAGFSWSVTICAHCFTHLGWHYQSGGDSFFGLILANLVRDSNIH